MRGANALLVAGIVTVIAGLSGASLAADDGGRAPGADVIATGDAADAADPATSEETEPADPVGDGDEGRDPEEVETEEVAPTYDGGRGGDRTSRADEREQGDSDRGEEKQPLADIGVDMKNIAFKPDSVTVKPGDEVTWTNKDTAQHNAVGQGAADFDTGLLEKGENATVPFNDTGTFRYICTVHPSMKGEVKVASSGSGGSGGKGGASTAGTGGTSADTGSTSPSGSSGGGTFPSGSSSTSGGSLPNTGQAELPLLLLGAALIVLGLLGRAFHEYWIWR